MKQLFMLACVAGLIMYADRPAEAGVTATILDIVGDPNSIDAVQAGDTFSVKVEVNTDISLSALQFRIKEFEVADGFGVFTLNSIAFSTGVWSDDADDQIDPTPQTLNASNSYTSGVIGDLADNLGSGTGTGEHILFGTISLTYNGPNATIADPAYYKLNLADIVYGNLNFDEFVGTSGTAYTVEVIPAPGAALLGVIGMGAVGWYRKRYGVSGTKA